MATTVNVSISRLVSPRTVEQTGIGRSILEDLALKTLYMLGEVSVGELAAHMRLKTLIVDELVNRLRKEMLCEVKGMSAAMYRIQATSGGRSRALELLAQNQYVGPAPVPMADYVAMVRRQSGTSLDIHPEDVQEALKHLVLNDSILAQLGTALVSGKAIFLYGPPGTGKTSVAEAMTHVFRTDEIYLPYAVEVNGQFITIYDPAIHQNTATEPDLDTDQRWVPCRRPRVMVGGELTIEMLDLQYNPLTRFYTAPVQMKANNGLLIVDDFGRQRVRPDELLNRWVIPLDRKTDFLTLAGGHKLEVPFDAFVVFATNIDPAKLVDEAFLRRIQNKVLLDAVPPAQFHEIFRRVCAEYELAFEPAVVDELIRLITGEYGQPLRPCYPRDIVSHIRWSAQYARREPRVDGPSIRAACEGYFIAGSSKQEKPAPQDRLLTE